jgi:hypothetical protein
LNNPDWDVVLEEYADDGILYNLRSFPETLLAFPLARGVRVNWRKSRWLKRKGKRLHPLKFLGLEYNHKIDTTNTPAPQIRQGVNLSNAPRTSKPYVFDSYSVLEEAWTYDNNKLTSPEVKDHKGSFIAWFKTYYHGFIMSRIYNGRLDTDEILPTFTYHYKRRSCPEEYAHDPSCESRKDSLGKLVALDVFNSSFAHKSLANRITKILSPKHNTGFCY